MTLPEIMCPKLCDTDVVILCGGLGTRLRGIVPDLPKALATIAGRPFLDILLGEILSHGFKRLVFCTGVRGDKIIDYLNGRNDAHVIISNEAVPLGTGGAVVNVFPHITSDPFIVINGDSICRVKYESLLAYHLQKRADVTLVVTANRKRNDVGVVEVDKEGRVMHFTEKDFHSLSAHTDLVNAGVYVFSKRVFYDVKGVLSLEKEFFPRMIPGGKIYGYVVNGPVTDIGTPERYIEAQENLGY